jgi:hypothetical protein
MKTLLVFLAVAGLCLIGSTASAAVFVHAGPVNVAVGHPLAHVHPIYRTVVARPIYRPALVCPYWAAPVVVPAPTVVVPPPAIVTPARVYWHRRAVCIP